jgi:putative oxidoreductase
MGGIEVTSYNHTASKLPVAMSPPLAFAKNVFERFVVVLNFLQAPVLLAVRLYFFWQLFQAGSGKFGNIPKVTEFFANLHIPFPLLNVYLVASVETFGSLLLIAGLLSRLSALAVFVSMSVAYLTADFEAVSSMFSDPDKFVKADPFPYFLIALIILVFGPGWLSLDALIGRWTHKNERLDHAVPASR